ncbi:hypothetical protein Q8791_23480 [Nocardiopsis sp. CT-R113]|uniref:Uncharacterized protein n=1 Tax=Nocardiopsis codii TaxID=3065942 RepID=A0ABU7KD68_9ACTN|nr:hypothetical protein [Nocardiopsis sp. CT-R113]MEE2040183.1 hypothetical protein [Nocardiopsis sp. CT-R113]
MTPVPNGKLAVYEVTVNGYPTKMQLTEAEARSRGLIADEPDTKPTGRRTKATKQEGDE